MQLHTRGILCILCIAFLSWAPRVHADDARNIEIQLDVHTPDGHDVESLVSVWVTGNWSQVGMGNIGMGNTRLANDISINPDGATILNLEVPEGISELIVHLGPPGPQITPWSAESIRRYLEFIEAYGGETRLRFVLDDDTDTYSGTI